MDLEHRSPNCAGEWEQASPRGWQCRDCRSTYHDAPEVGVAAHRENEIGRVMKVLAAIGQQQIDAEGPSW